MVATNGLTALADDSEANQRSARDLLSKAERYLSERAQRVTDKFRGPQLGLRANLTSISTTDSFSAKLAQESVELDARRERLHGYGGGFSDADVRLDIRSIEVAANTARLQVVEDTKLFYGELSPGAPTYSTYSMRHTFTFVFEEPIGWILSSDETDVPSSAVGPFTYVRETRATPPSPLNTKPGVSLAGKGMSIKPEGAHSLAPAKYAIDGPPYDYQKMADYAQRWARSRNPAFPQFGNDCMNFVSQSLLIGGWDQVRDPDPARSWYVNSDVDYSHTWSVSHDWYFFALDYSRRTTPLTYFEDLRLADVMQADWDNANGTATPDGHLDHTMIVTLFVRPALDGIFLSYHTNDTLNRRLDDLLAQVPPDPNRANYYGHRT